MSISLNYKVVGEGQPLLILHGLFGSLDNWQTMARTIAEQGFQVFTIDLRNHGKSPHTEEMNHSLMQQDVAEFIIEHKLQDVVLMGHSMGGKTAMKLALEHPQLLQKLIIVDIAPKPYTAHHNIYFDAMMTLPLHELTSRGEAQRKLGEKVKNQAILQFLLKNLERRKEGGFQWKFNLNALYNNYDQLIDGLMTQSQFNKPTLFINGKLSDYITPADTAEIKSLFPLANICTIDGAGHWVHAEKPADFFDCVIEFLK